MVRLSEGINTTPKDVLSDSSASSPSAPTAFLWMVYLESESITFPTLWSSFTLKAARSYLVPDLTTTFSLI